MSESTQILSGLGRRSNGVSEADLRAEQHAVAGVVIERHVGGYDVALRLHDDRYIFGDWEGLRDGEPPAPVKTIAQSPWPAS